MAGSWDAGLSVKNGWFYGWEVARMHVHPPNDGFYGQEHFRIDLMVMKCDES